MPNGVINEEVSEIVISNVLVKTKNCIKLIVVPQALEIVIVTGEKHGVLIAINCNLSNTGGLKFLVFSPRVISVKSFFTALFKFCENPKIMF